MGQSFVPNFLYFDLFYKKIYVYLRRRKLIFILEVDVRAHDVEVIVSASQILASRYLAEYSRTS